MTKSIENQSAENSPQTSQSEEVSKDLTLITPDFILDDFLEGVYIKDLG